MEPETGEKWEGKFSAKLAGLKAEQVWPLIQDFGKIHKWLPSVETCQIVQGISGQVVCIRYCGSTSSAFSVASGEQSIKWATEKLVALDATQRYLTYEIVENNIGFGSYMATMKVLENDDGCEIEWCTVCDPVLGWKQEDFVASFESRLQGMTNRIKEALQIST